VDVRKTSSLSGKGAASYSVSVAKAKVATDAKMEAEDSKEREQRIEHTEKTKRNKMGYLHRKIIDFQKIFDSIVELSGGDAFIFLDDLYHLRRADQAQVLDQVGLAKGRYDSTSNRLVSSRQPTDWLEARR
jgi:hypothetical protein